MRRIVVLGQPGVFGRFWIERAALRLAKWLRLPCIGARDLTLGQSGGHGWIVATTAGDCCDAVLRAADTAIWLHFPPHSVLRAWLRELGMSLVGRGKRDESVRLADVRDSFLHMAWTPQIRELLSQPSLSHLQVFLLRNPGETDFWLRVQEYRYAMPQPTAPMPG